MTQDDLNNSNADAIVDTVDSVTTTADSSVQTFFVQAELSIETSHWDAALASAADALVLVQWLESKRSS
tara:strand:+ start:1653 stop:1859 length:207 start_codon:yes stop_codon:yes gene_type:complete